MPEAPLQFGPNQQSGLEPLAGASPVAINVVIDGAGAVRRRPGIATTPTVDSDQVDARGIVALHRSPTGLTLAVGGGDLELPATLYQVTPSAATALQNLWLKARPQFAETEAIVALTGDLTVRRVDVASPHAVAPLGGSPPQGTQVIAHGGRLLIDDPAFSGRVHYSAPAAGSSTAGHEQWGAQVTALGRSGFFTAEARPDPLVALRENLNEVFVFGQTDLQVFAPEGTFVYSPVSTREHGCAAAGSVVRDEHNFAWLDDRRRIVYSDGRNITPISDPIKASLDAISDVSDCFAYRVLLGPVDAFVWTFPSGGVSYAFQRGGGWSEWSGWDDGTNNWSPMLISAADSVPGTNENLVGTTTGHLGALSLQTHTDLGARIPASVTTGFQNHGTDRRKQCKWLYLALRRGEDPSPELLASLEYRDDLGGWSSPIEVSLGSVTDDAVVVPLAGLGVYRRRQWRFSFHGTENITLASAVEEFEVLSN